MNRRGLMVATGLGLGFGAARAARGQPATWPTRSVRIMVPYAAGGSTDILTRLLAQKMSEGVGQSVVVDNKGGAGGNLGVTSFVASSFDDHSLLMVSQSQISINQFLFRGNLGYDPVADLKPVGLVAQTANVVVVPRDLPVTTFAGLIEYAKARPGEVSYSSAGVGSTGHLINELLRTTAGIDIVHVPYRGNGPAMQALLTGEVQFNTDNMPQLLPQIRAGGLRPLAVTSEQRWPQLPDVPTVGEVGYPTLNTVVWFGLVAQVRMQDEVVGRINAVVNRALQQSDFEAKFRENSLAAIPSTPERMAQLAESERHRWGAVVSASGARAE